MFSPIPRIEYLVLTDAAPPAILCAMFAVLTILASVARVRAGACGPEQRLLSNHGSKREDQKYKHDYQFVVSH